MRAQLLLLTFCSVSLIFLASFDAKIVRAPESKVGYIRNFDSEDTEDAPEGDDFNSEYEDNSEDEESTTSDDIESTTSEDIESTTSEDVESTTTPSPKIVVETDHPPHSLNVTKAHETFDVAEGDRLTMPCNVRLTPKATVVWRKGNSNGSQLISNSYPRVVTSELYELDLDQNAALVIKHANRTDEGVYTCIVSDNDTVESVATTHDVEIKQSRSFAIAAGGKMYACLLFLTFLAIFLQ